MTDRHRIIRILEYVGSPEFIRSSIEKRAVKGRYPAGQGGDFIQEALLESAEVVQPGEFITGEMLDRLLAEERFRICAELLDWMRKGEGRNRLCTPDDRAALEDAILASCRKVSD